MLVVPNPEDFSEKCWLVYIQEQRFLQLYIVLLTRAESRWCLHPLTVVLTAVE